MGFNAFRPKPLGLALTTPIRGWRSLANLARRLGCRGRAISAGAAASRADVPASRSVAICFAAPTHLQCRRSWRPPAPGASACSLASAEMASVNWQSAAASCASLQQLQVFARARPMARVALPELSSRGEPRLTAFLAVSVCLSLSVREAPAPATRLRLEQNWMGDLHGATSPGVTSPHAQRRLVEQAFGEVEGTGCSHGTPDCPAGAAWSDADQVLRCIMLHVGIASGSSMASTFWMTLKGSCGGLAPFCSARHRRRKIRPCRRDRGGCAGPGAKTMAMTASPSLRDSMDSIALSLRPLLAPHSSPASSAEPRPPTARYAAARVCLRLRKSHKETSVRVPFDRQSVLRQTVFIRFPQLTPFDRTQPTRTRNAICPAPAPRPLFARATAPHETTVTA